MPQEKFRSTCDSCAASKIKCTQKKTAASNITSGQEKPQCIRCRALGKECHYSRSRRAGRSRLHRKTAKPAAPPRLGTPTISPATLSIKPEQPSTTAATTMALQGNPTAIAQKNSLDLFQFSDLLPFDGVSSSASSNDGSSLLASSTDRSSISSASSDRNSISLNPKDTMFFSPTATGQDWLFDVNNDADYLLGDLHTATPPLDNLFNSSNLPSIVPNNNSEGDRCAKLATETLNSLYEMASTKMDGNTTDRPSVSQAMAGTARAIQNTLHLMSCFCQKDYYLPVIIAVIVSKIIAWSQAIVCICNDGYSEHHDQKCCAEELVVEEPLALGAFQLEDQMGRVLKNQIVLDQLRSVSDIVARYHTMFCSDGAAGCLGGQVYSSMGAFLNTRLQQTMQKVESRLRACANQ